MDQALDFGPVVGLGQELLAHLSAESRSSKYSQQGLLEKTEVHTCAPS